MENKHFHFIIAGAGAAGLSLLTRMIQSKAFADKRILLIDQSPKTNNDRTWCFWQKGTGVFEDIIYKSWDCISIHGDKFSKRIDIRPYQYKMIRGIDFYEHCFALIEQQRNITVRYGRISRVGQQASHASVILDGEEITADVLFNSIRFNESASAKGSYNLIQHFFGWVVKTDLPVFDTTTATLMDFRTPQHSGCSFVYVMPFSAHTALVEYTVFGKSLFTTAEYEEQLRAHLQARYPGLSYEIESHESGMIPMTDFQFPQNENRIFHIGTAGGQTKPSTGYTFQFIQRRTAEIVASLQTGRRISRPTAMPRYRFYDRVLLNVLATGKHPGSELFIRLFDRNPASRIFRFLDNESSLSDDLKLISTLPVSPFLKASFE